MRFAALFLTILAIGAGTARADTIVVSGLVRHADRSPAGGYVMQAYIGKRLIGSDTTLPDGMYTIVSTRINVDPQLLKLSYVICTQNDQYTESSLQFVSIPDHVFQAKVPNLKLSSTAQSRYNRGEATETIHVVMTVEAIRSNSGEIRIDEANEQVSREATRVLGRTDLGEDPAATMREISEALRRSFDRTLPQLPLLQEDRFLVLLKVPPVPKTRGCDPTKQEQTDLSGTYTGKTTHADGSVSDNVTLTITGNNFTMTGGPEAMSGRITAVTTCGYTAVTMTSGDMTPPAPGAMAAAHTPVSLRAKKVGDRLTLTSVPGEPRKVSFVSAGAAKAPRKHRATRGGAPPPLPPN